MANCGTTEVAWDKLLPLYHNENGTGNYIKATYSG